MAATPSAVEVDPMVEQVTDPEIDDRVLCAQCRETVTARSLAIERAGAHEQTFRNPAGYSWTIACFRDASGCRATGELTTEASWFADYAWCYAECAQCSRHLGWWFVGRDPSFVGLIVTRLTRGSP